MISAKYTNNANYIFSYKVLMTTTGKYKSFKETTATTLHSGWNLSRARLPANADAARLWRLHAADFAFNADIIRPINRADIDNGATFVIKGMILDDSFGQRHFELAVKLNDPKYFSPVHKDPRRQRRHHPDLHDQGFRRQYHHGGS